MIWLEESDIFEGCAQKFGITLVFLVFLGWNQVLARG